jgi:putative DNA-invertase from lambdoid prophage Rac
MAEANTTRSGCALHTGQSPAVDLNEVSELLITVRIHAGEPLVLDRTVSPRCLTANRSEQPNSRVLCVSVGQDGRGSRRRIAGMCRILRLAFSYPRYLTALNQATKSDDQYGCHHSRGRGRFTQMEPWDDIMFRYSEADCKKQGNQGAPRKSPTPDTARLRERRRTRVWCERRPRPEDGRRWRRAAPRWLQGIDRGGSSVAILPFQLAADRTLRAAAAVRRFLRAGLAAGGAAGALGTVFFGAHQLQSGESAHGDMIVAIYARVSTVDQSCEMQLRELREYAQRQSFQIFAEYVDTGFSGSAASRPRLDQLLRDARLRRFEAVLVWKLDRWGRSVAHCVRSTQELVSLGVRFASPTESIDTGTESPMSRFLLHLFAAFAEMEREIIRERVRAGVRNARAKGTRLGRPQRVFRRDEVVRLRTEGKSWRKVAQALNLPMSTVIDAWHGRSENPRGK